MSNEFINLGSTKNHEDFQLRYISFSKYEGDWQSLPHTHQFSELFYVLHGEGVFYIENEKISVKTDDLMIINPNVEHTERTLPNNPMEYIVFGVEAAPPFPLQIQSKKHQKGIASIVMVLIRISL